MNETDILVFNAHSGEYVKVNRYYFVSLDELKNFCSNQFNIPSQQLFLISPFGIKLKRTTSLEETNEIYIFDRNLFSASQSQEFIKNYIASQYSQTFDNLIKPISSPLLDVNLDKISQTKNSRQMMSLLTTNLGWVAAIQSDSLLFHKTIIELLDRIRVLFKALRVATQYIDSFCLEVKKNYDSSYDFVIGLQRQSLNLTWKDSYKKLKSISLINDNERTLSSLLDQKELENQAHESIKISNSVNNEILSFKDKIENSRKLRADFEKSTDSLESETAKVMKHFEAADDLKELSLLSDKVQLDTKHLLSKSKHTLDTIDLEIILETVETHKNEFVDKIFQSSLKIYKIVSSVKELFSKLQIDLTKQLQGLSLAQTELLSVKESLKMVGKRIEQIQSLESSLSETVDLPLLYGLYLVEDIRRSEWLEEVKSIASKTMESFAFLREREIKYRSQWVKTFGSVLKLLNHSSSSFNSASVASLELGINEDTSVLPASAKLSKEDVLNYLDNLNKVGFNAEGINVINKALNDLPLRRSRIKLRELDTPDSGSSEQLIRGYKVRIKKLESLLHQEQFKNFNQWPSQNNSALSRYSVVFDKSQNKSQFKPNSSALDNSITRQSPTAVFERSVSPPEQSQNSQELEIFKNENDSLKKKIQKMKDTIEATNSELKSVRDEFSTHFAESNTLQRHLDNLKGQHTVELSSLKYKITDLEKQNSQFKELSSKQKADLTVIEGLLEDRDSFVSDLKRKHAREIETLQDQILENDRLKAQEFEELESELKALKVEHKSHLQELQANHEKDVEQYKTSSKELPPETSVYVSEKKELESLREELESLRKELEEQKSLNCKLDEDFQSKKKIIDDLNEKAEKQDSLISALNSKIEDKGDLQELEEKCAQLKKELDSKVDEIAELNAKSVKQNSLISSLSSKAAEVNSLQDQLSKYVDLEKELESKEKDIEGLNEKSEKQNNLISELNSKVKEIKNLQEQKDALITTNLDLNKDIDKSKEAYGSLVTMKDDLLENMSNRENEFAREKKSQQGEIESLKMKVEELEKLQDDLKQFNVNERQTILQLIIIINSLIIKARDLSEIIFNDYGMFCATLRSIGLLAVKQPSGEVNIIRVKGLRKLGDTTDFSATLDQANGMRPDLEQDALKYLSWAELPDLKLISELSSNIENGASDGGDYDNSQSLDLVVDTILENYNLENNEDKYLAFVNQVTNLSPIYKSSISKRFREVENLAKRELKENKKFKEIQNSKISIRDFKVGDLVLFLPTRSASPEATKNNNNNIFAWAAFNDTGDMKYLLKNDLKIPATKQWVIGKILNIEHVDSENNEFHIIAEEVKV